MEERAFTSFMEVIAGASFYYKAITRAIEKTQFCVGLYLFSWCCGYAAVLVQKKKRHGLTLKLLPSFSPLNYLLIFNLTWAYLSNMYYYFSRAVSASYVSFSSKQMWCQRVETRDNIAFGGAAAGAHGKEKKKSIEIPVIFHTLLNVVYSWYNALTSLCQYAIGFIAIIVYIGLISTSDKSHL